MRSKLALVCLAVAASASVAYADDVTTKAGSVFKGEIVAEDDAAVTIDTATFGRLRISRADISKIKKDAAKGDAGKKDAPAKTPKKDAAKKDAPAAEKPAAGTEKPKSEKSGETKSADAPAPKAPETDENGLTAEERDERRRTTKIVRRTTPQAVKAAADAAVAAAETKATFGGAQLAQVEAGAWVIVFQPPKTFEATPVGIQLGRRLYARVESIGAASAWLASPGAGGEQSRPVRLADVQRHFVTTPEASRVRMLEGVDQGAWLRMRLDDGTVVQGSLKSAQNGVVTLVRPSADGKSAPIDVNDVRIVEIDGLVRSTATKLALAEAAVGEHVALTSWPDGREIVGVLKERDETTLTIESTDGAASSFAVDGPIAELHRVPAKWRVLASNLDVQSRVHARAVEEFPDARVERDLVGKLVAITAYSLTLDTPAGVLVLPFESLAAFEAGGDYESVPTRPMKASERSCSLPALPGDPAEKAKGIDADCGVAVLTDGSKVKHVFVAAPFEGEVFGIRIHDKVATAQERTDLRFDSTVVQRAADDSFALAAETSSCSLAGMRVTLVLDSAGTVSAIEVAAR
jgi:hypothetical protein